MWFSGTKEVTRRATKRTALRALKSTGAFRLARHANRHKLRILAYHGAWIADDEFGGDAMFILPETFERRMKLLRAWGYRVVCLEDGLRNAREGRGQDDVCITIDDGWWSTESAFWGPLRVMSYPATLYVDTGHLVKRQPVLHVMANYLERLARRGDIRLLRGNTLPTESRLESLKGLVDGAKKPERVTEERLDMLRAWADAIGADVDHYLDSHLFDYLSPEMLRTLSDRGLDVQLHTHRHSLGDFGPAVLKDEIETNRRVLTEVCGIAGERLSHLCYPSGEFKPGIEPILDDLGVRSAVLVTPGLAGRGSNPYFLPRILDGNHLTDLDFEAELCGVLDWVRAARSVASRGSSANPAHPQRYTWS